MTKRIFWLVIAVWLVGIGLVLYFSDAWPQTKTASEVAPECETIGTTTRSISDAGDEMTRMLIAGKREEGVHTVTSEEFAGVIYMHMQYRNAVYDLVVCLLEVIDRERGELL